MKQEGRTIKLVFPLSTHINITWFKPFTLRLWSVTKARGHEQVLFISVSARTFLPKVCMGFSNVRPPANLSPTGLKYSFGWIKSHPAALITGVKRTLKGSLQLTNTILFFILQKKWWARKQTCENESDLRSYEHYLSSSERRPEKIQACTGFEPMTSAIPVQCSTNWANKPTGSWSLCWFQINSWSGE